MSREKCGATLGARCWVRTLAIMAKTTPIEDSMRAILTGTSLVGGASLDGVWLTPDGGLGVGLSLIEMCSGRGELVSGDLRAMFPI